MKTIFITGSSTEVAQEVAQEAARKFTDVDVDRMTDLIETAIGLGMTGAEAAAAFAIIAQIANPSMRGPDDAQGAGAEMQALEHSAPTESIVAVLAARFRWI